MALMIPKLDLSMKKFDFIVIIVDIKSGKVLDVSQAGSRDNTTAKIECSFKATLKYKE